ncbi:hypothetical protein JD276_15315 [Leucobacter sp. CSA1]|uniref:Uncharacterized protein n=1 Tax=Leucobacter chromiisoli TaxID=2796471 RepID=A0A934QC71_9MICO|nr:hypothetical protein [Leucobacter chromiisoli]MBK0420397.1 hypothetical protein [Leucobacter chromiisoli]
MRFWTRIGAIGAAMVWVAGCGPVPVVADAEGWDHSTLDEQRAWVEARARDAIRVLGEEGWWEFSPEFPWPAEQDAIMRDARTETCRPSQRGPQPGRLRLDLNNDTLQEPFDLGGRLKEHWLSEGWAVSTVIERGSTERPFEHFRAVREDGAVLGLQVGESFVSLSITSSCSDHPTVTERYSAAGSSGEPAEPADPSGSSGSADLSDLSDPSDPSGPSESTGHLETEQMEAGPSAP